MFWYVSGYNLSRGLEQHKGGSAAAKRLAFRAGTPVTVELGGNQGYIIVSGEVRCDFTVRSAQQPAPSLGLISLLAGECFGSLNSGQASHAVLTAVKDTQLVELTLEGMLAVAKGSESVQLGFSKGILRKRIIIPVHPETLVFKTPKMRIEEALKVLAGRIGSHRKSSVVIRVRPTSARLARMAGLGRLHTLLVLAELSGEHKLVPGIKELGLPL